MPEEQAAATAPITRESQIEARIKGIVLDNEFKTAQANQTMETQDFEQLISMIECKRTPKDYKWMSDVMLPEYASHFLSLASDDAMTYFSTREFVEVYHEDESDEGLAAAAASKRLINNTLNQRHLDHYAKYMRAKVTNNMASNLVIRCWWEQETKTEKFTRPELVPSDTVDVFGDPLTDPVNQTPMQTMQHVEDSREVVIKDRFNYDVLDPRNVFFDDTYTYSIQDKRWVIVRFEKTMDELEADKQAFKYINLDILKEKAKARPKATTQTAAESFNKEDTKETPGLTPLHPFDIVERHGKFYAIKDGEDEKGEPVVRYGIDTEGNPLPGAELMEMIITFADDVLIRFQVTPFKDAQGNRYRPLIRAINYIHPTKDGGLGDGKYSTELQMLIDDTMNAALDRNMLATLPVLKARKYAIEDNETIQFAPEHIMELFEPDDVQEFEIDGDISGPITVVGIGRDMMQQVNARYESTMGALPEEASTTATAVAGADTKSNARTGYRSLTWEYVFLAEFYWMISQMTWQFMRYETAVDIFGGEENVGNFRPDMEFWYKPVTGAILSEYSKSARIKESIQLIQILATVPNPKTLQVINMLLAEILEMWGKEKVQYAKALLDEEAPFDPRGAGGGPEAPGGDETQNELGLPQSLMEQFTRGGAMEGAAA